jgi:hypothetical protein
MEDLLSRLQEIGHVGGEFGGIGFRRPRAELAGAGQDAQTDRRGSVQALGAALMHGPQEPGLHHHARVGDADSQQLGDGRGQIAGRTLLGRRRLDEVFVLAGRSRFNAMTRVRQRLL